MREERNERLSRNEWEWRHRIPKPMRQDEECSKRWVYSTKCLHQKKKRRKFILGTLEQREREREHPKETKSNRWQDIIKLRAEISKMERKESMEQGVGSLIKINKIDRPLFKIIKDWKRIT